MGKLKAKARNALPSSAFAGPNRSYPIPDRSHAANALSRVSGKSAALKARVRAVVARKYPTLPSVKKGKKMTKTADRTYTVDDPRADLQLAGLANFGGKQARPFGRPARASMVAAAKRVVRRGVKISNPKPGRPAFLGGGTGGSKFPTSSSR